MASTAISKTSTSPTNEKTGKKNKFYVVYKGKNTGIFDNWIEAQKQVNGVKGSAHASFKTLAEASTALQKTGINHPKYYFTANPATSLNNSDDSLPTEWNDDDTFVVIANQQSYESSKSPASSKIPIPSKVAISSTPTPTLSPKTPTSTSHPKPTNKSPTSTKPQPTTRNRACEKLSTSPSPTQPSSHQNLNMPQRAINSKTTDCSNCQILKETVKELQYALQQLSAKQQTQDDTLNDILKAVKELQPPSPLASMIKEQTNKINEILDRQYTLEFQLDPDTQKASSPKRLAYSTSSTKPVKKRTLLPTPNTANDDTISNRNHTLSNNNSSQSDKYPETAINRQPEKTTSNQQQPGQQSSTPTATKHKNIDTCQTIIIGDSTTVGMRPSKVKSLAIRSYPKASIKEITEQISAMTPNPQVNDLCLSTGTHNTTRTTPLNSHAFKSDYLNLIHEAERSFPNAYITICGLMPKRSNSRVISDILSANDILYSLCSYSDHLKYLDILPSFVNQTEHQNMAYYESDGFYLNQRGNILLRSMLLDTIACWQSISDQ